MLFSLKSLFSHQYNRNHPFSALKRFIQWKLIRVLKLTDIEYKLWGDRKLLLNYDSFQSMWVMYNYIIDWEEFNLISRIVKRNDNVCDIGANMGFYTIWMSKFIEPPGFVHAFEPDEKSFSRLEKNVKLNSIQQTVRLNQVAIYESDNSISFTTGLDGENHISEQEGVRAVSVKTKKLDTYAQENGISSFSYVKIDVEGFEYSVLKGAQNLLETKKISLLQLELNKTLKNSDVDLNSLLQLLSSYGYQLCGYDLKANKLFPIEYSDSRENYFAAWDIAGINNSLDAAEC